MPRGTTRSTTRGPRPIKADAKPAQERGVTVAEQQQKRMTELTGLVAARQAQLAALLGTDEAGVDRFVTVALQTVQANPSLLECSALSLLGAIRDAATYGLEPAGMLGDAAIVPYRDPNGGPKIASLQIEYRGLRKLALRGGGLAAVDADIVYERDRFEIISGDRPAILHVPSLEVDRGSIVGAYAWARFTNGELVHLWMPIAEVLKRRDVSRDYLRAERDGKFDSIWHRWPEGQIKKTPLRRLILEKLPMSPLEREAIAADTLADVSGPSPAAAALGRLAPAGSEARNRLLDRMGLTPKPAELEPGPQAGSTPPAGSEDQGDGPRSVGPAEGGEKLPEYESTAEKLAVDQGPPLELCGAPSPYQGESGEEATCRKLKGHQESGEPGAKMHKGPNGETWADPE